jgi:hypothetical protein
MSGQSAYPALDECLKIDGLREAIQANQVAFPCPVPVFACQHRADIQWRLVELYFVHNWSPQQLASRYKVSCSRVRQALRSWVHRAKTLGYLQSIPAEEEIRSAAAIALNTASRAAQLSPPPILVANRYLTSSAIHQNRV